VMKTVVVVAVTLLIARFQPPTVTLSTCHNVCSDTPCFRYRLCLHHQGAKVTRHQAVRDV
jgi:hypothetical protein